VKSKAIALAVLEIGALFLALGGTTALWEGALSWESLVPCLNQALVFSICCAVSFYYNDLYALRIVRSLAEFSVRLPQSLGGSLILLAAFYAVFPRASLYRGSTLSSTILWDLLIIVALVLPLRIGFYALMRMPAFAERVLILGTGPLAYAIAAEIKAAAHLGYSIVGFVDDRPVLEEKSLAFHHIILGPLERLAKTIAEVSPDRIIVVLAERRGRLPVPDLLNARMSGIIVEDGIEVYERFSGKLAIESLSPSFLIFSKDFTKSRFQTALRRAMSLAVAVVGLIVAAPLLALIAVLIKLDSQGPVFFIQDRAGLNGSIFRLVKFRTMHPPVWGREAESVWNRDVSSRITRIGRWLRKTRLDELPQFINILRGDMDLVGPRPEMASNVRTMLDQIPYYSLRMAVRPGITGWAQIKQGYSVSQEDVTEKMRYDLYYVKHMSLWFDLRILVDTVKIVLLGEGSEVKPAVTEAQRSVSTSGSTLEMVVTKK
jgi:exopolysaccharide biosynthesis polyprenyl glycosylphosphotransferase